MLFLLSISITLVGALLLVSLILFSQNRKIDCYFEESGDGDDPVQRMDRWSPEGREDNGERGKPDRVVPASSIPRTSHGEGDTVGKGRPGGATDVPSAERVAWEEQGGEGTAISIPILRSEIPIPGMNTLELIHYLGKAGLYTMEDQRELGEIQIVESSLQADLQGELALSSKNLIVFDGKSMKKFPYGSIEKYHFQNAYLLIKKRNVKKKKTVLKIFGNIDNFRYILNALLPL